MKKNMGHLDRLLRVWIVAPIAILVGYRAGLTSALGVVALLAAAIMLLTSAVSFCPLYLPFGLSTRPARDRRDDETARA